MIAIPLTLIRAIHVYSVMSVDCIPFFIILLICLPTTLSLSLSLFPLSFSLFFLTPSTLFLSLSLSLFLFSSDIPDGWEVVKSKRYGTYYVK